MQLKMLLEEATERSGMPGRKLLFYAVDGPVLSGAKLEIECEQIVDDQRFVVGREYLLEITEIEASAEKQKKSPRSRST